MIVWSHWHNEPLLIGTLVAIAWAYALVVGPWRSWVARGIAFPYRAAGCFGLGLVIFYAAVGSPLDQIGERFLFSAHMLQHMVIIYVVAPLIYAGTPPWLTDAALRRHGARAVVRVLTRPVTAAVIFALVLTFWHSPAAYDHALRHRLAHVVQHLTFFAAALVLWWPLFSRSAILPRLPPGPQILYLVGSGALQMPLIAFLVFSRTVLYPTYEFAPRLLDLTPRDDQILGGALMGVGGTFITLGLIARAFYSWNRQGIDGSPATPSS